MTLEDIYAGADCGQCPCVNFYIELGIESSANEPDCTIKVGKAKCPDVKPDLMQIGNTTFNATVGFNQTSFSQIVLDNSCGDYDEALCECFWTGREAKLFVGLPEWDCDDYLTAFCGSISGNPAAANSSISVILNGLPAALQKPIGNTYPNGDPIPLVFGCVLNAPAYLVDGGNLIFQVNDGPILPADTVVYDNGSPLTFGGTTNNILTANPAPGEYVVDSATGQIKLGAPFDGPITVDTKSAGLVTSDTASIIEQVLAVVGEDANIDAASLAAFQAAFPYDIGIALTGTETVQDVINSLVSGAYGWWGVGRDCEYEFGLYRTPDDGTCDYTITEKDIELNKIQKLVNPETYSEIYLRYGRNWTPLQSPAAITQSNGTYNFFTGQYTTNIIDSPAAFGAYGQSSIEIPSYIIDEADAQAFGSELSGTLSGRRECISVSLMCGALQYERGKTVCIESDRFCANKKPWYIESVVENVATMQATLTLCRTCPIDPPCFLDASVELCECPSQTVLTSGIVNEFCVCFNVTASGLPAVIVDYQISARALAFSGSITMSTVTIDGTSASTNYPGGVPTVNEFFGGNTGGAGEFKFCIDVDPSLVDIGFIELKGDIVVTDATNCEPVVIPVDHRCEFIGVENQTPQAPDDVTIDDCEVDEVLNWQSATPFFDPEGDPITITATGVPTGMTDGSIGDTPTLTGPIPAGGPFTVIFTGSDGNSSSTQTVIIDCDEVGTTGNIAGTCNVTGFGSVEYCGVGFNVGNGTTEEICDLQIVALQSYSLSGTPQNITLTLAGATAQTDFASITVGGVTLDASAASFSGSTWTWGYPGAVNLADFNAIKAALSGNFTVDYVC